jgi:hypothetical protein
VHRFAAANAEEAKALAVEAGVPADQIVDAAVEDGAPEEVRENLASEPESAEPRPSRPRPRTREGLGQRGQRHAEEPV